MPTPHLKPELIVMLTHHDKTVPDALELFERTKEYPIKHWGFKDVGLPPDKMQTEHAAATKREAEADDRLRVAHQQLQQLKAIRNELISRQPSGN